MFFNVFVGLLSRRLNTFILSFLILILSGSSALARDITLIWDANSEPDLSHYVVYWGIVSGDYSANSGNIGLTTEYSAGIPVGCYRFRRTSEYRYLHCKYKL